MKNYIQRQLYYWIIGRRDKSLTKYYRYLGAKIGENCSFIGRNISLSSEPYLITIGNHVRVSFDVAFVTHDGGTFVLREKQPNVSIYGKIIVGNNVFIGARSIIMPNVIIGDNCIVAAGSVVTRNVESGTIVGGVPARKIGTIDDYANKHTNELLPIADHSYNIKKREIENFFNEVF